MKNLLRIDSSVRQQDSNSSKLADVFCNAWTKKNPQSSITKRHVGLYPPSHPTHTYTVANYTPEDQRTQEMLDALEESDQLINELHSHDEYLFAIPMYNFSIPSTFKAYIDNIVRVGMTFSIDSDGQFMGLLNNKKLTVISSRGATYTPPSPLESLDLLTPYIKTVMGFMGITEIDFIYAEDLDFSGPEQRESQMKIAEENILKLFEESDSH